MLPDYPRLKEKMLSRLIREGVTGRVRSQGVLGQLRRFQIFEGNNTEIWNEGRRVDQTESNEISGRMVLNTADIENQNVEAITDALKQLADDIATKENKMVYGKLASVTQANNMVVDAVGQTIGPEHIFEIYDRLNMEFDAQDKPCGISLIAHPSKEVEFRAAFQRIESDPALRSRFERLMREKREQWRAREADRQLVE